MSRIGCCGPRIKTALRVQMTSFVLLMLAVVGCQSSSIFIDKAIDYNDKTLVIGGCENGIGRGFQVCRFIDGSPMESELLVMLPVDTGYTSSELRIRHGDDLLILTDRTSGIIPVKFKEIFGKNTWSMDQDGPIQILATTTDKDGPADKIKYLGYIYVVILKHGYNPKPIGWPKPSYNPIHCTINFNPAGSSQVKCSE